MKNTIIIFTIFIETLTLAHAKDTLKSYTSSLLELDNHEARIKKIRLIYTIENVWNQSLQPNGTKELKLRLTGGSGFDMTNIPNKKEIYGFSMGADYRYSIPTAFKLIIEYSNGATLRHINHAPENSISTTSVSQSLNFNLGFSLSQSPPSINGGVSWRNRITYEQPEFQTITDFNQHNESVSWLIENQTIRNHTPPKDWLLYHWTSCNNTNLIEYDDLPIVMRSDFKPQVGIVYRKNNIQNENTTEIKLFSGWRKTNYYFGRDWCTWHTKTEDTWTNQKDHHQWTESVRLITVGWFDNLYY
ncbi:leukocidin family pore-forming toxin [Aliivibrio sp. S10_S31]|uniref:leukocidin family pore-forming toxin n=1 Tax=Aliivibrio sp. S10_S31 TaxID=2720224 RepID=UPI0016814C2C|nr:leukocidin family pore-forming toxin [Aliivibrio sp. S10_S31]MBD1569472.1 dTDP-glucose 4,6-dehydratase [Aliivibrio sp. S10_S31]